MMVTISSIAYSVRAASDFTSHPIKLSHAQQLVAAALGYKSLASYQASKEESAALDEAAHFVLDAQLLATRSEELKLPHKPAELMLLVRTAFNERIPAAQLHSSEMALDGYVRDLVQNVVLNHGDMASGMAMTNNNGIDEIYLPFDDVFLANLPPLGEILDVVFDGHVSMIPDIERPYSGHKIEVKARLIMESKGRVCVAEPICEVISARLNWGGDDHEDDVQPTTLLASTKDVPDPYQPNTYRNITTYSLSPTLPATAENDLREGIDAWTRMQTDLIILDISAGEPHWLEGVLKRFDGFGTPTIALPSGNLSAGAATALKRAQASNTIGMAEHLGY